MGVRDLCLGSINHGILAKEARQSAYTKYFSYVFCHMKVYVTDRSLCKDEYILAHMVGEEYAAFLPKQMKIEEESAARLYFASVIRSALKSIKATNPDFTSCFPQGLTYETYEQNQEFEIGYKEGSVLHKYPDPFKNPTDFRAKVSVLMEFNNKKADVGAMFGVAYDIVLMLALMMLPVRVNLPKEVLFLTFVTFAKKGLANEEYIKKVEVVVEEELKLSIKLNENQIKKLWKYYEPRMTADMMEHCVKLTLAELPEESVRLRKLVELSKWHGLTCYRAVKQALDLPGFPWNRLTNLAEYQTEMKAYEEAARLVGDNSFYGYNPSMGKAKSVYYKNLASVCARILVETKTSPALDKAACFITSYQSKNVVDGIITEYVRQGKSSSKPKAGGPGQNVSTASGGQPSPRKEESKAAGIPTIENAAEAGPKSVNPPSSGAKTTSKSSSATHLKSWPDAFDHDFDDESSWPDAFDHDFDDESSWPDGFDHDFDDDPFDNDFDGGVDSGPDLELHDSYDVHDDDFDLHDPYDVHDNDRSLDLCDDFPNDTLDSSDFSDNDPLDFHYDGFDDCINGNDALDSLDSD